MDKKTLTNLVNKNLSTHEIGRRTGKSQTSIRYWMNKYKLKSKWGSKKTYTDAQLKVAVSNSTSIHQVLKTLGLDPRGRNYPRIREAIERLELDTTHFGTVNKPSGRGRPLKEYLIKGGPAISSYRLKQRLFREGVLENSCCSICGMQPKWNDKPLNFRLDHINGDSNDNRLENLRLVCPNCDSQLPTYCAKNRTHQKPKGQAPVSKTEKEGSSPS